MKNVKVLSAMPFTEVLQKTYTVDFLTKKKVMNRGIIPQYYIEDAHEAIIPKELFHRVKEEKASRASIYRPAFRKKGAEVKGKYSAKAECADEMFDKEYRVIADEIKELKKKKAKVIGERQLAESYDQRLQDMESYMKKTSYLKREFNDDLVRRPLETVRVINESKLEIQFKSGIVMTQRIDFED